MKREDFILGTIIYLAIIAAGHYRPFLEKLKELPWGDSIGSLSMFVQDPLAGKRDGKVQKTLLVAEVKGFLKPEPPDLSPAAVQDSIRQSLDLKWKRMAAHPLGLKPEWEPLSKVPLRQKARLIPTPQIPERKGPDGQDSPKG